MADASNKKRGALRQITKDDRAEDKEEASPSEHGTFARASDEVLATRKIVKVRRSSAAPSGPNLFANIQLVAPASAPVVSSTPAPALAPAAVVDSPVKDPGLNDNDGGENANGNGKAKEVEGEQEKEAKEEVAPKENGEKDGGDPGKDLAVAVAAGPKSFDQVSSSTNAFGSFGTAFSASSFSFSATGSTFSFGSSSSASGFGFFGSSTTTATPSEGGKFPLFGQAASSAGDTAAPPSSSGGGGGSHPTVSLQEVPIETGEEKEKAAFSGDGILYEFVDKSWKERGKGELKLNLSEDLKKARLVMRSRGNLKLLLNASLFPDMRVSKMDGRSVTFACVNSAAKDGKAVLTTYAVKLRDAAGIPEFLGLVEMHKGIKPAAEAETEAAVDQTADDQSGATDAQRDGGGEEQAPKEQV